MLTEFQWGISIVLPPQPHLSGASCPHCPTVAPPMLTLPVQLHHIKNDGASSFLYSTYYLTVELKQILDIFDADVSKHCMWLCNIRSSSQQQRHPDPLFLYLRARVEEEGRLFSEPPGKGRQVPNCSEICKSYENCGVSGQGQTNPTWSHRCCVDTFCTGT